jgi:hypothetical protein
VNVGLKKSGKTPFLLLFLRKFLIDMVFDSAKCHGWRFLQAVNKKKEIPTFAILLAIV